MYFKLRLIPTAVATLLVAACGGGGGGGSSAVASNPSIGVAVDGYLSGSAVYCDIGNTGVIDTVNDPVAYTQTNGKFVFPTGCTHQLLVSGGTSSDTGLSPVGVFTAPAGSKLVTPLTTLLAAGLSQSQLNTALNLPSGTDVTALDPAALDGSGNLINAALYKKTLAVQQLLLQTAQGLSSLGNSAGTTTANSLYAVAASALAKTVVGGTPLLSSDTSVNPDAVGAMLQNAVSAASTSTQVDSGVKSALAGFSPAAVAAAAGPAYVGQANALLGSGSQGSAVGTVAAKQQSSTFVSNVLGDATNKQLLLTSTAAASSTLAALGNSVASADATGTTTLDTVLANFEESSPLLTGTFYAGADIVAAPASGGSGKVLQISRGNGANYAGGWVNTEKAIAFTSARKTLSAQVYSPVAGIPMPLHVDALGAPHTIYTADTQANETVVKGWQTLTWTISDADLTKAYQSIVLTPNLGTTAPAAGEIYYYDNFVLKTDAPPIVATHYLKLTNEGDGKNDTFTLANGSTSTKFSMAQFQSSAGISTSWPLASNATLSFSLSNVGGFTLSAGQKVDAALQISQVGTGTGVLKAYVQNVALSQSGNNLTVTVPVSNSNATAYASSATSSFAAIVDYSASSAAGGVTSTLNLAGNNTFNLGNVVNYAANSLSSQFSGINALTGTFQVTLVVTGLPLYQASGVIYPTMTINVPTSLTSARTVQSTVPITGQGIVGYVTLTP